MIHFLGAAIIEADERAVDAIVSLLTAAAEAQLHIRG
jgi:hypothetical protein